MFKLGQAFFFAATDLVEVVVLGDTLPVNLVFYLGDTLLLNEVLALAAEAVVDVDFGGKLLVEVVVKVDLGETLLAVEAAEEAAVEEAGVLLERAETLGKFWLFPSSAALSLYNSLKSFGRFTVASPKT